MYSYMLIVCDIHHTCNRIVICVCVVDGDGVNKFGSLSQKHAKNVDFRRIHTDSLTYCCSKYIAGQRAHIEKRHFQIQWCFLNFSNAFFLFSMFCFSSDSITFHLLYYAFSHCLASRPYYALNLNIQ